MKKILPVVLCLAVCIAVLSACGSLIPANPTNPTHEHTWSKDWSMSAQEHWHACTSGDCTEVNGKAPHTGGTATCLEKARCATCGAAYGELAAHTYDKEVVDEKYLATEATCTQKATYFKSCVCGEKGTETFESGSNAAHTPDAEVDENVINPTCNRDGSKDVVVYCSECDAELSRTSTSILSTGNHNFDYEGLVCKQEGDTQHSIKCNGCDTYNTPVDCTAIADNSCETAELCVCGREITPAKTHSYTGVPAWTASAGTYSATYACDNDGCTAAPKSVTISITSSNGVETIEHIADNSEFKFAVAVTEGYGIVSVKIGDLVIEAVDGVYSAPIEDAEIVINADEIVMHTVTFYNWDRDGILATVEVEHGKVPVYPGNELPTEIWKKFVRATLSENVWDKELSPVTEDTDYFVVYNDLYEFEIFEMSGDEVTPNAPTWGGHNIEFPISTRAHIQKVDKFRVTLTSTSVPQNADYREHDSISFYFKVNYDGITLSTIDGTVFLTTAKGTNYHMVVDNAGKVYINGVMLDGIIMSDGVISFDITTNPETDTYAYFEVTNVTYDAEIKSEFASQLKDMYNSTGANGTKTVEAATNEEKLAYGVTQFTVFTAGGWQEQPFDSFDLTPYEIVKFYGQRLSGGSIIVPGLPTFYCDPNVTEFKFVKNGAGYDLYVAGTKQELGDTVLTNLNQLKFNIGTAGTSFRYSDVVVDSASYIAPPKCDPVSGSIYEAATPEASPSTTPDIEDKTGLELYAYTSSDWANASFDDIDLLQYEEVKFYVISLNSKGSIKTNSDGGSTGTITYLSDGTWKEIHLVKNAQGTGFDVYVNNVLSTIKFYTDNNRTTEIPLTNLKQLTLNQDKDHQFLISNLFVISDSDYVPTPDPSVTKVELTLGNDGAISGEGVVSQTIVLPSARVWNINDAAALTVTVYLTDAAATADAISINGVAIGAVEATVKINNILYLAGSVDYSTAGQVSFKIAYIQDKFYWNTNETVNLKSLEEDNGVYTVGPQYNLEAKADSKITESEGVSAYHANVQRVNGTWYDNWRLTLNKTGMNSISFYMTFNFDGGQLYAKDGIGDPTKLIHTFTANEVILVTIQKDGSVLINGVDSGVNTSSDSFVLDFYNGGSDNAYGTIGISADFWRYNNV